MGGGGGGAVVSGEGHPKIFEHKGGGPSQKLKVEEVFLGCAHNVWQRGGGGGQVKFSNAKKILQLPIHSYRKKQ